MSATVVDIYNRALSNLGTRSRVVAVGDGTKEEKAISAVYADMLDELFSQFPWNFAKFRLALATQGVATAPDNWSYVYAYPSSCLKARFISAPGVPPDVYAGLPPIPYEVGAAFDDTLPTPIIKRVILTNQPSAILCYTVRLDESYFPAHFRNVFSWKLAAAVALNLTNAETAKACQQTFMAQFEIGIVIDAQEGISRSSEQTSPWDVARGQGVSLFDNGRSG